jgi:hypothetical protein
MYGNKYLDRLNADGDLIKQLRVHAKEYDGPCGQSMTGMEANRIKKQTLLDAAKEIEDLREKLLIATDNDFYLW